MLLSAGGQVSSCQFGLTDSQVAHLSYLSYCVPKGVLGSPVITWI